MKKLLFAALAALFLIPAPVKAEGSYVIDETGTLTSSELTELNNKAQEISEAEECGIYVILTDDLHGYSEQEYAFGLFMNYDLGYGTRDNPSGVLLAVAVDEGYYDSVAYGPAGEALGTSQLDELNDDVFGYLSSGNWYGACDSFIDDAKRLLDENGYSYHTVTYSDPAISQGIVETSPEERKQYFLARLPIAALIAFALSFLINLIRKSKLKNVGRSASAADYIKPSGTHLDTNLDLYTGTTHSRMHMPRNNNSSGGGGGGHTYHSSGASHSSGGRHF